MTEQRGWGPFTGRQLTTIILAAIIGAVMLPGAVWAVDAFTNVAIQDPVSGVKAGVDSSRRVLVGDGAGPLTVDGTAKEVPSNTLKHWLAYPTAGNCVALATPTAGKAIVIKALHVDTYLATTTGPGRNLLLFASSSACGGTPVDDVNPGAIGVTTLDFGAGLALPAGQSLWALISTADVEVEVYAFGYEIAGSAAPPPAPSSSPVESPQAALPR